MFDDPSSRRARRFPFASLLAVAVFLVQPVYADSVDGTEINPPPGVEFPSEVAVSHDDGLTRLALTGMDVRRKYFVDVYWVAHYMQDPPNGSEAAIFETVLTDGPVKQLTLQFVRDVKAKRLRNGVREDFKRCATKSELSELGDIVERFVASVRDAQIDDRFVLRWLPGGRIQAAHHDEVVFDVTDPKFARIVWSIWFGEKSIVEREARMPPG